MAEEARLESVYTPKGYPEFESRSLRKMKAVQHCWTAFFVICNGGEAPKCISGYFLMHGSNFFPDIIVEMRISLADILSSRKIAQKRSMFSGMPDRYSLSETISRIANGGSISGL